MSLFPIASWISAVLIKLCLKTAQCYKQLVCHVFLVSCFSLSAVSPYSPDRMFLSEDLTRLEAAMGVKIMSVLASHVSQLASLSGVTPLPQPQSQSEEYVKKLISRWCDGLSSVSPTWKHLLEIISGAGLPELSADIEAFMKGQLHFIHSSLPIGLEASMHA